MLRPIMAFTQQDLAAIDAAIKDFTLGKRVTELRFSDRLVRYQDGVKLEDLESMRARILGALHPRRVPLGRSWRMIQGDKGL